MAFTLEQAGFTITNDPARADLPAIYQYLSRDSYWAQHIPYATVVKALQNSLCFHVLAGGKQVGFARVVTDQATFAYLCDVYILPEYQGRGLSKWLMASIKQHPELQQLRRFMLATKDAHGLYAQFGFKPLSQPERLMEIVDRDVYAQPEIKK